MLLFHEGISPERGLRVNSELVTSAQRRTR